MDKHNVGTDLLKYGLDAVENIGRDVKKSLLVLHDGQVVVRRDMEGFKHLIEHLTVLSGHADHCFESSAAL